MLTTGDYVRHQVTGRSGKVVGHGHQISDLGAYLPTLQVLIEDVLAQGHHHEVLEDLTSVWEQLELNHPLTAVPDLPPLQQV